MSPRPDAAAPPVEVPQLGPSLGRLIVPRRGRTPWVPLDDVREELATAVIEFAGQGRGAAARDRSELLRVTGRGAWMAAWERAVQRLAVRIAERIDGEIDAAARRVRMPQRARNAGRLSGAERRAIAARLAAGGGPFVAALDQLDQAAAGLGDHPTGDASAWVEALCGAARRLEAAWLALEAQVEREEAGWNPEIVDAAAWRPSLVPLFAWWLPVAAVLVWLGLVFGGYVPAPRWLAVWLRF